MEEFQESDVLWPHHHQNNINGDCGGGAKEEMVMRRTVQYYSSNTTMTTVSRPISIPTINVMTHNRHRRTWSGDDKDLEEMVPPHVVVDRRVGEKTAGSLMGSGRTLKGRQLSQVRNSVLRMTGFLETC